MSVSKKQKKCTKCKLTKDIGLFPKAKQYKNGIHSQCKKCRAKAQRISASASRRRAKRRIYDQEYRQRIGVKEKQKNRQLLSNYGISLEERERRKREQNGKCAICQKDMAEPNDCNVDHDHSTGKIRGLLCRKCNLGISYFDDKPFYLYSAIKYITHNSEQL